MQATKGELPLSKLKFEKLGYVEFDENKKTKYTARELKSAYVDCMAMLVRLMVHPNHENKLNLFNQVSLIAINCLGDYFVPFETLSSPSQMGGRFEEEI